MVRQHNDNIHRKTMTLSGQGQVTAVPDTAVIRLGVQTSGENLAQIQAENARMVQSIIQALQRMGVNNIKTFQYSIDKVYDYDNGRQIDRGFSVRNIIEIRTNNLDMTGSIIDTAVNSGANVVDLISFDVANREYYYQQALNGAIRDAIQKSKSIAMNLNMSSEPIPVSITENSSMPIQPFRFEFAAATPIIPGSMLVEANVTVDFEY
ncbi:SIMPL domain-containing protein [Sedimentibacter sp.]|uniref:SIMPL domain-containing protein n=1 Tax=Sedimentibacter sp. TaxID=1960295 RepID=UPI00289A667F|nr:SIMPL domain-containing protein [Sedimentibacter sp.]